MYIHNFILSIFSDMASLLLMSILKGRYYGDHISFKSEYDTCNHHFYFMLSIKLKPSTLVFYRPLDLFLQPKAGVAR